MGEKDLKHGKLKVTAVSGFWLSHMARVLTRGPVLASCPGPPATPLTRAIVCMPQNSRSTFQASSPRPSTLHILSLMVFVTPGPGLATCTLQILDNHLVHLNKHTDLGEMGET